MRKYLITLLIVFLVLSGCYYDPYDPFGDDSETSTPTDPWSGYKQYLSLDDYYTILDTLEGYTGISRTTIDSELEKLNVRQNYDYSYYDGTSNCHTMNWNAYSSTTYDWIYYIDVDIWVDDSGMLKRDMCSYYEG